MFSLAAGSNLLAAWNSHRASLDGEKPDEVSNSNESSGSPVAQLSEGMKRIELAPGIDGASGLASPEAWMAQWRAKHPLKADKASATATPALSLRRITFSNLPEWAKVSDVLSLIHGATIDQVTLEADGKAVVLLCDANDCKNYHGKYAQGIHLDNDDLIISLELGPEHDTVDANHRAAINAGATRVVAVTGVSMEVSFQIIAAALQGMFEMDKIIYRADTDKLGILHFLFASIDDAVKFTAKLKTEHSVEGSTIAHEADPCKVAAGFHDDSPSVRVLSAGATEA